MACLCCSTRPPQWTSTWGGLSSSSDPHWHLPQPGSRPPSAVCEQAGLPEGRGQYPLTSLLQDVQGAIKSRSLVDQLTVAVTRLLELAQSLITGLLLLFGTQGKAVSAPAPGQLWAGTDPRACPARP